MKTADKIFRAGSDLGAARRALAIRELVVPMQEAFSILEDIKIPVVAAVQGGCIGGGMTSSQCGDPIVECTNHFVQELTSFAAAILDYAVSRHTFPSRR